MFSVKNGRYKKGYKRHEVGFTFTEYEAVQQWLHARYPYKKPSLSAVIKKAFLETHGIDRIVKDLKQKKKQEESTS